VTDLAEPLLQAETMMRSSITLSLILARQPGKAASRASYLSLPLCTMKTSCSRIEVTFEIKF